MKSIYLINGNIYHLIDEEIEKIVAEDGNVIKINYNETRMSDILSEANYFSLDNSKKYIVIKNCNLFNSKKDDDEELLLKYIDNPNENSVLIFVVDGVDLRKKIVKSIKDNSSFITLPKIDYKNIYNYINEYLKKYKYSIEFKASGYLVNVWGLNLDAIYNELDKMMLFYNNPCSIKYNDIISIVSKPLDNNNFHFLDACINKDFKKALAIYKDLRICKVEESMLVILLYKEYKKVLCLKKYTQLHYDANKIASILGMQNWQIEKLYNSSLNYSEKELLNYIKILGVIDKNIKTGQLDKSLAIYNFLLEIGN